MIWFHAMGNRLAQKSRIAKSAGHLGVAGGAGAGFSLAVAYSLEYRDLKSNFAPIGAVRSF